jgi:hypothetical protein
MRNILLRFALCLLAGILLLTMVSCSALFPSQIHDSGLDAFSLDASERGLTEYLLPTDGFIEKYAHTNGDYHYFDNLYMNEQALESGFVYLEYEEATYKEAKQFCLDSMSLSTENAKEYRGYVFAENLALTEENRSEDGKDLRYPRYFIMFGYNDALNRLVFISLFCGDEHAENAALADTDFGAFLKEFYGEYYDFGASA